MLNVILSSVFGLQVFAAMPVCDESIVVKQCEQMKASSETYFQFANNARIPNPFLVKDLSFEEQMAATPRDINSQKARVQRIFNEVKESLFKSILRGRNRAQLSPEEQSMMARLEAAQFRHGDLPSLDDNFTCVGNAVDVGYSTAARVVQGCRGIYELPDASLHFIFGHELGHSVDSCQLTMAAVEKRESADEPAFRMMGPRADTTGYQVVAAPMTQEKIPYASTRECLSGKGFQSLSQADMNTFLDRIAKERCERDQGTCEQNLSEYRAGVDKQVAGLDCSYRGMARVSQMPETTADIFGAIALQDFARNNPEMMQAQKLGAFYNWSALCKAIEPVAPGQNRVMTVGSHPSPLDRFMKITMQIPEVAKVFGCSVDENLSCLKSVLTNGPTGSAPARPQSAPAGAR